MMLNFQYWNSINYIGSFKLMLMIICVNSEKKITCYKNLSSQKWFVMLVDFNVGSFNLT